MAICLSLSTLTRQSTAPKRGRGSGADVKMLLTFVSEKNSQLGTGKRNGKSEWVAGWLGGKELN